MKSLEGLLQGLIDASAIEFFSIETRAKKLDSFEEKVQREDKAGKYECLEDVTDLCGIRIITYLQEDCDSICRLIESEFEVDEANSVRKGDELDPDKFGYLSTHFVVSLKANRASLREFSAFTKMKAEIQVRTLLQHTWATIDWKFRYKEERESPRELRRRLFRISALLEAADNEFSSVKVEIDKLRAEYADRIGKGNLDIPLNSESALSFESESQTAIQILAIAEQAGIRLIDRTESAAGYNRLVGTADMLGIRSLSQLNERLQQLAPEAQAFFEFVVSRIREERPAAKPALIRPAILRYLLMSAAPPKKRQEINMKYKPAGRFGEAIAAYARKEI